MTRVFQIRTLPELCDRHCEAVIELERKRGLEISDRRSGRPSRSKETG